MRASSCRLRLPGLLLAALACLRPAAGVLLWGGPDCTEAYTEDPAGACRFPSRGPDGNIGECQPSRDGLWCPTTADYCAEGRFRWCPGTDSTYGGTDPGRLCHFPFVYKGAEYRHCTRSDTRGENYLWCSTTPGNYSGLWTRCKELSHLMPCQFSQHGSGIERQCVYQSRQWLCRTARGARRVCDETDSTEGGNDPGRPCSFPFKHNGVRYSECQRHSADGEEYLWCATTPNFDRDHLWTLCKQRTGFQLQGILLLLVVVAGAVLGACALAYLLHCLCERSRPLCRLCWTQRGRRANASDDEADNNDIGVGVADIDGAGDGDDDARKLRPPGLLPRPTAPLTPTAPPPPPTYEEAVLEPREPLPVVMATREAFA